MLPFAPLLLPIAASVIPVVSEDGNNSSSVFDMRHRSHNGHKVLAIVTLGIQLVATIAVSYGYLTVCLQMLLQYVANFRVPNVRWIY